jgi:hypothetical protein
MASSFVSNYNQPSQQILLDLVNDTNTQNGSLLSPLTTEQVDIGGPVVLVGDDAGNTSVSLTAIAGSGYSDSVTVKYNRIEMSSIPGALSTVFSRNGSTTLSGLLTEINTRYGLQITQDDIVDATINLNPLLPNGTESMGLTASSTALVWLGQLPITIQNDLVPLDQVVLTVNLGGLTTPTSIELDAETYQGAATTISQSITVGPAS